MAPANTEEFLWIAVMGGIFAFVMAFGIGANDVANAFGTSVAAKTLTIAQAILVSSVFEFSGSVLLGAEVTGTIRNGILKASFYKARPILLMFGNLCALLIASIWLLLATAYGLPVSTTHTIIAALIGFSLAASGFPSIEWLATGKIFISWFAAPAFSGVIAFVFFSGVRLTVMRTEDPFKNALRVFPFVIFAGVCINVAFILLRAQGNKLVSNDFENFGTKVVLPTSVGGGFVIALIFHIFIGPCISRRAFRQQTEFDEKLAADKEAKVDAEINETEEGETTNNNNNDDDDNDFEKTADDSNKRVAAVKKEEVPAEEAPAEEGNTDSQRSHPVAKAWDVFARHTFRQDLEHQSFEENKRAQEIWAQDKNSSDPATERLFSYLQVFTACMTSFAHGSNDVANGIAPFSGILDTYRTGRYNKSAPTPKWILAYGGVAICLGFTFFGYQVIKSLGYKLICMSPSRGFCIELATALAVSTASYLSIPISSTQCLVGATVGAGVASGGFKNVQWLFLLRVTVGWVATFFVTCFCSAGLVAYCIYSPSLVTAS